MAAQQLYSLGQLKQTLAQNQLVVVDFFASWCGPCKAIAPVVEDLAKMYPQVKVVKIDVDQCKDIAMMYGVKSMPTFMIFSGGEAVETMKGADEMALRRTVELYANSMPTNNSGGPTFSALVKAFAEMNTASPDNDAAAALVTAKKVLQEIYEASNTTSKPFGVALLPSFIAGAVPAKGLENLLAICLAQPDNSLENHDARLLVEQIFSFATTTLSWMTAESQDGRREMLLVVEQLMNSPTALKLILESPSFTGEGIKEGSGRQFQTNTYLGAALGLSMWDSRSLEHEDQLKMLTMFPYDVKGAKDEDDAPGVGSPSAFDGKVRESSNQVQRHISTEHDYVKPIVRQMLGGGDKRLATLKWFAKFLEMNEDYKKEMNKPAKLSTRSALHTVANVLLSLALPVVTGSAFPASVPASYVVDPENALLSGCFKDIERIGSDKETMAEPSASPEPYKPAVELFYLAAYAQHLSLGSILAKMQMWSRNMRHPDAPVRNKKYYAACKFYHTALVTSKDIALRNIQFSAGTAKWLLHVAGVNPHTGALPQAVPKIWMSLPQFLFTDVIQTCDLITDHRTFGLANDIDYYTIMDIVSLMLVLMGNMDYFSKPHIHAIFPRLLLFLTQNPTFSRPFESHHWYSQCILNSCVKCYIAVSKAEHEKVNARYYLSMSLPVYLSDRMLCDPVRESFENDQDPLLEKFAHVVTSEASSALDGIINTLGEMHEKETGVENVNDLENNELYVEKGKTLEHHIVVFKGAIKVFSSLATMFPKGVLRHFVAQQISLMLVKSLTKLAGKNSKELKIRNPEKYGFNAKELLQSLVECFVLFDNQESFLSEVHKCGIAVSELYWSIDNICSRNLVAFTQVNLLSRMKVSLQNQEESGSDEKMWDEAPEFALCELMNTPLYEPVALPSTGEDITVVDLQNIRHHLLDEQMNPYTRQKMTLEELEEFNEKEHVKKHIQELKDKIEQWKKEYKASH